MASIFDWSTTASSNASVGSINWAEGMAPSAVNDSARYEMADVAGWRDLLGGAKISTGTDTIALTSGLSISAYAQGMMFAFEAGGANTGAVTLNVDSVGAKAIKKYHDVDLASGDIEAAGIYLVAYEATADNFQLLSPVSNAPGDASGPASSTDNAIVRFDGTGGKTVQDTTGWSIDDSNVMLGGDNTLQRVNLKDYGEVTNAIGSTGGGTQDIDLTLGNSVSATVDTSANTFTFSNPTASDQQCGFVLYLTNGGSQTVNWPAAVDWAGGTAPTLTAAGKDILCFTTIDGGTTWYGFAAGLDMQ